MVFKHYDCGGPAMAWCAWCGQAFSALNFHSVGSWSLAVPGSATFKTTSRSGGGRERAHETYFVTGLIPLPAARRLSPWPTSRRVCSDGCLKQARAYERTMLEEADTGGPVSKSTKPRHPDLGIGMNSVFAATLDSNFGRRSLSPARMEFSPAPDHFGSNLVRKAEGGSSGIMGAWLGVLKVKITDGISLVAHEKGQSVEMIPSNCFCIVAFGRQQRATGTVKAALDPQFGDELLFDVYESDVPVGFLASPDRRERKKSTKMGIELLHEELQVEKKQRTDLLRRVSRQIRTKTTPVLTAGLDHEHCHVSWHQLGVNPGPDNSKVTVAVFHRPTDPKLPITSLGNCSASALELVRDTKKKLSKVKGRLVHPDSSMMARGILNFSMTFNPAEKCGSLQPQGEGASMLGLWQRHETAGTHRRPSAAIPLATSVKSSTAQARISTGPRHSVSPEQLTRAFIQINLQEDLPWKKVEHESEWKIRVQGWDKTNTRKISMLVDTGIRHGCSPVAVSQSLRDQARFQRLLVYYIEKKQHELAESTIQTMRRKGLPIDAQVMAIIAKYEGEAQYDEEGALVHREPSFHFNDAEQEDGRGM